MKKILGTALALALAACGNTPKPAYTPTPAPAPSATPAGTPSGPATAAAIGPDGGTLTSSDGRISISIPAGALSASTTVSVQPITNNAPGGVAAAYRLSPAGQTFAKPVRLALHYDDSELAGSAPDLLRMARQEQDGAWQVYRGGGLNRDKKTVVVPTRQLGDLSFIMSMRITPETASVRVGKTVNLQVERCYPDEDDDLLTPLVPEDVDLAPLIPDDIELEPLRACHPYNLAVAWSVNGTAGGSAAVGTVAGQAAGRATYTAPGKVPRANPVAVTAKLLTLSKRDYQLYSSITVTATDSWSGTITTMKSFADSSSSKIDGVESTSSTRDSTKTVYQLTTDESGAVVTAKTTVENRTTSSMHSAPTELCVRGLGNRQVTTDYTRTETMVDRGDDKVRGTVELSVSPSGQYRISAAADDVPSMLEDTVTVRWTGRCRPSDDVNTTDTRTVPGSLPSLDAEIASTGPANPDVLEGSSVEVSPDGKTTVTANWRFTRAN
jgi:hypothetical protein